MFTPCHVNFACTQFPYFDKSNIIFVCVFGICLFCHHHSHAENIAPILFFPSFSIYMCACYHLDLNDLFPCSSLISFLLLPSGRIKSSLSCFGSFRGNRIMSLYFYISHNILRWYRKTFYRPVKISWKCQFHEKKNYYHHYEIIKRRGLSKKKRLLNSSRPHSICVYKK